MSPKHSRKSFFAKILGVFAAVGVAPKLLAKQPSPAAAPVSPEAPFTVRPDARSVARQSDSV